MAEIELKTAPADFRFPTTNQTRHCFTRYIEFHRVHISADFVRERNRLVETVACKFKVHLAINPGDLSLLILENLTYFLIPLTPQNSPKYIAYLKLTSFTYVVRCVAAKGEESGDCNKFAKYYRSLCPGEWIDRWNEQRENGTFPGPL
ncbi:Cytochrome c oxidase subunitb-2 [Sesamum angolense]|uniref:Cytochrome c oxidase subunitb-2 n=1 Tax=Sesamum angolense TaxID=2727404 RepID=A0AAE1WGA3_9LAMI|nr:Cytochrome c oxidase subunitb-2 [Sesamum angolense]